MNEEIPFGHWIRRRRKALDLTQETLAQRVGCSVATIRKIETGSRRPSQQIAERLADCLEISSAERTLFIKVSRAYLNLDVTDSLPPLHKKTDHPHNLPAQPNALMGREREMKAILTLLQRADVRLVTLTGPGGIGKTRLAISVAQAQLERFVHGAYFVSLAPVSSADFLVSTIANALQFSFYGTADPNLQLLAHLGEKNIMLVLDNFEHLLDGTGLIADIIHQAPGIVLLVTSRERLNIEGEWVIELAGLSFPRTEKKLQGDEKYGAVQLFLERARQISTKACHPEPFASLKGKLREGPGSLDEEILRCAQDDSSAEAGLSSVIHICQMVEGMPLGIELAATWGRVLSYEEIAREIEKSLAFLATTSHSILPRHRSIVSVFEPSWSLLSSDERRVFQQLSIFRGGFRREAAERVVGATLTHLAALVDKSLLRYDRAGRYDMHELVRQYAAMKLEQLPAERDATCDLHSSYYAEMLYERKGHLRSYLAGEALKEMRAEIENIRQAWQWTVTHRKVKEIKQSLQSLLDFYDTQGWFQEGEEAFKLAAAELKSIDQSSEEWDAQNTIVLGQVLAGRGWLNLAWGRYEQAVEMSQASLELLRRYEAHEELMNPLITLGVTAHIMGDYSGSRQYLQESLALQRASGDRWGEGWSIGNLGVVAYMLGEYQKAYDLISEALALFQELGDKRLIELCYSFLSMTTCALGNHAEAERLAQDGIALSREISHRWGEAIALCNLGVATYYLGRTVEAGQHLHEGLKMFRMIEEPWGTALALNYLANGWYIVGAYNEAERCALEALEIATKAKLVPLALEALLTLAAVRIQNAEKEAAHALLLFFIVNLALQHSASTHRTKERARGLLADAKDLKRASLRVPTELEPYLTAELMPDHSPDMPQFEEIVAKVLKGKLQVR